MTPVEPIHVLYGGAHLFLPGLLAKLHRLAHKAVQDLAEPPLHDRLLPHVAVQNLRIDFEDGFGLRSHEDEDAAALAAGRLAAQPQELPPCWGLRIKPLSAKSKPRALRTLELFCQGGVTPPLVTLPKIQAATEVDELSSWLHLHRLPTRIELMVETASALRHLPELIDACHGRCASLHFGAYDFLSELGVSAADQSLSHPFCDHARFAMQLAAAGRGIPVVDGVTSLLPVGAEPRRGWDLHIANVRRSLSQGFHSSWDVHPAQVAARYAALFSYYDEHKAALAGRLHQFLDQQAQATRVGAAFDDAATVRGLARFFLRGLDCGALQAQETGFTRQQLLAHA